MDLISFMIVVWALKVLAEDGWATVKGQTNPRIQRRKERRKSRSENPVWTQLVGWLGDLAEDAREESRRRRKLKREQQDREEIPEAEVIEDIEEAEIVPDEEVVDTATPDPRNPHTPEDPPGRHEDLTSEQCTRDICPYHKRRRQEEAQEEQPPTPAPKPSNTPKEKNMSDEDGEIYGLDACIAYCEALIARLTNHTAAGASGEQYTGMLGDAKVEGMALQTAHEMQAAIASAVSAIEAHKTELDAQKIVQEAFDTNPDAGDKEFQQAGR